MSDDAGGIQPVHLRHFEVKYNHIRSSLPERVYRFLAIAGLVTDLPIAVPLQGTTKISADGGIVVGYQNTNFAVFLE